MSTGSASLVTIETAGRVGTITLNRSQVHNALNREMVAALSSYACIVARGLPSAAATGSG